MGTLFTLSHLGSSFTKQQLDFSQHSVSKMNQVAAYKIHLHSISFLLPYFKQLERTTYAWSSKLFNCKNTTTKWQTMKVEGKREVWDHNSTTQRFSIHQMCMYSLSYTYTVYSPLDTRLPFHLFCMLVGFIVYPGKCFINRVISLPPTLHF